jgi:hypothetical protein
MILEFLGWFILGFIIYLPMISTLTILAIKLGWIRIADRTGDSRG